MKKLFSTAALIVTALCSNVCFSDSINCDVNSKCAFSLRTNSLNDINLNAIQKDHLYSCKIEGLTRLNSVDTNDATEQGIQDVNFSTTNVFLIDASFNTKALKNSTGHLKFKLTCGVGDTPCVTSIACSAN